MLEEKCRKKPDQWSNHTADVMRSFHEVLANETDVDSADYLFASANLVLDACVACETTPSTFRKDPVYRQCCGPFANEREPFCEKHVATKRKELRFGRWDHDSNDGFLDKNQLRLNHL